MTQHYLEYYDRCNDPLIENNDMHYYASGVPMAQSLGPNVPLLDYSALGVQYTEDVQSTIKQTSVAKKYLRNGIIVIEHRNKMYNAQGIEIR